MSDIVLSDQAREPALSESAAIIQVIERAALNPDVDIDKMERLLQMQERIMERTARSAYVSALAQMQPELPEIVERGKTDKTSYALWEDINEAIKPHLAAFGFALSFRTGITPDGKITVTGVLSHREGHAEETTMTLPQDTSGSKNAVQAVGSSTSYGKRYTAMALLNITSRGEDDDGKSGGQNVGKVMGPKGRMIDPMSPNQARKDGRGELFDALGHEITSLTSVSECMDWAVKKTADIETLPVKWRDDLRASLREHMTMLREAAAAMYGADEDGVIDEEAA